jgi:hypothetical protein
MIDCSDCSKKVALFMYASNELNVGCYQLDFPIFDLDKKKLQLKKEEGKSNEEILLDWLNQIHKTYPCLKERLLSLSFDNDYLVLSLDIEKTKDMALFFSGNIKVKRPNGSIFYEPLKPEEVNE